MSKRISDSEHTGHTSNGGTETSATETGGTETGNAETADLEPTLLRILASLASEMQPGFAVDSVTWKSRLDRDLGLDSLARVELLLRLEQRFDVRIREDEIAVAETPRDLLHLIGTSSPRGPWSATAADSRALAVGASLDRGKADDIQVADSQASSVAPEVAPEFSIGAPREARTLIEVLDWHCQRHPDRRHLSLYAERDRIETLSYRQLLERSLEIAAGLRAQGLDRGEPVALMLPTGVDYFYLFYGVLAAGLVPVPLYPPVRPSQLEDHLRRQVRILDNCRSPLMVTIPEAKGPARLLRTQVPSLRQILTVDDLRRAAEGAPRVVHPGRGSDLAFLQYTSGSTGQPKGVALSHDNLLANLRAMLGSAQVTAADTFVSWLPLYHDMGLIGAGMGSLYSGMQLVLMSPLTFLARPSNWLRAVSDHQGTISGGPNFAYELCLSKIPDRELEGLDLSSWRLAFSGAEPVLASTVRRFVERFEPYGLRSEAMHPVYGLAEATLGIAFPPPGRPTRIDRIDRRGFVREGKANESEAADALEFVGCGYPLTGHQIRIADDSGREVPERAIGRVQFQGPSSTRGYYRSPGQTRMLFVGDWLDSGDLGYMVGGELFLTGRSKDLIIKAGRNLSPYEIEEAVGDLEGIRKGCVAAFSEGDEGTGTDRLIVIAETKLSEPKARDNLRQQAFALVTEVAGAAPDDVVLAPPGSVLKTSSGKIRRSGCRDLYQQGKIGKVRPSVWRQFLSLGVSSVVPGARRACRTSLEILYTFYVWLLLAVVVVPLALVAVFLPGLRVRQRVLRLAARSLLHLARVPLRTEGLEHLGPSGSSIIAINHSSYADAIVVAAALWPGPRIVGKRELGSWAPIGWLWRRLGVDLVERFDREQGVADARSMLDQLRSGRSLVVFPEGTFTRIPGLLAFRMGSFKNAVEAGVSVTPAVLRGTRSLLRAHDWRLHRSAVTLRVLPPIDPRGADWAAAVDLRDRVRQQILDHCGEPDLIEERDEGLERLRAERAAR